MAAGKWKSYDFANKYFADGTFDLDDLAGHPLKLALFLSTSNANTLSVGTGILGDLTNQHANANGYTTDGVALSGVTWTRSGSVVTLDASDLSPGWTASGGNIVFRYPVIYVNATVNSIVKPLLAVCLAENPTADVTVTSGNPLNVVFNASGILTLTGATAD
jgi:hypothetical protein